MAGKMVGNVYPVFLRGRWLIAALAVVLLTSSTLAGSLPEARPDRVGFDPERLERISEFMNARVANGTMVGGMGMIARQGKVIYTDTWGERDREAGLPTPRQPQPTGGDLRYNRPQR
jgi:hypothetical protein